MTKLGNLDCMMSVPLHIYNPSSATTLIQIDVEHLGRRVEVEVPNNIQIGHKIRLKGLGYVSNPPGDLIIEISDITFGNECRGGNKKFTQKMIIVENHSFNSLEYEIYKGWRVVDYKPYKDRDKLYPYLYVLLEKEID